MQEAVYQCAGEQLIPRPAASSVWGKELQHGGPPAALLARAVELSNTDQEMQVCRLTVDLMRPVPMQPLTPTVTTVRAGRRLLLLSAALLADGEEVCRATALLLRRSELEGPRGGAFTMPPGPDEVQAASLVRDAPRHFTRMPGFHTTIELRRVPPRDESGTGSAWLRLSLPLVEGEEITPLQRVAALADFLPAATGMGGQRGPGYINADSTIYLHRLPVGEWIGMTGEYQTEPSGIGLARVTLFDTTGPVGAAAQTRLLNERR